MSAFSLEHTLRDILDGVNPSANDWAIRHQIINELQAVIQSIESLRGATVEPFGSFVSNLFSRWGDLDISIELSNGPYIASAGKKLKQTLLGDVQRALRKSGGCRKLHFIANARVPILKFESSWNISCDISINNLSGQMKSKLLFWINEIDGRFRDVVLLVKEWAKAHNINDPKSGTLNSYSLSLLVLFHFQTCVPAILPPLKEIYPGNMVDELTGVRALAEKHVEEICAVNIGRYRSDGSRMKNRSSVSQLFISFFEKFSGISSKAPTQGISPYTGQWENINSNMRWLPKTYALFIEDPFEQPINTARTVSQKHLEKIACSLQTTYNVLTTRSEDRSLIVDTLVRPHIFISRVPGRYQGSYSNVAPHPQSHSVMQPSSPYKNIGNRPNGMMPGQGHPQIQRVMQQSSPYRNIGKPPNGTMPGQGHRQIQRVMQQSFRAPYQNIDQRPNGTISGRDRLPIPNEATFKPAQAHQSPRPNETKYKSVQARQFPAQQVWRPRPEA